MIKITYTLSNSKIIGRGIYPQKIKTFFDTKREQFLLFCYVTNWEGGVTQKKEISSMLFHSKKRSFLISNMSFFLRQNLAFFVVLSHIQEFFFRFCRTSVMLWFCFYRKQSFLRFCTWVLWCFFNIDEFLVATIV